MSQERDFDYVIGKLPRKDKDGNDTTSDRIGKGGRHRDDGTFSAVVYDLKVVNEDPARIVPPEPKIIVRREVAEVEKKPTSYEDLPWYLQLIYDAAQAAIPYAVDLLDRGINAGISYAKEKVSEHKEAKHAKRGQQNTIVTAYPEQQQPNAMVAVPEKAAVVPDDIDVAYESYSINMTSEEAQKEFLDAFILRLLSEKKLRKIAHANITDLDGNITDGRALVDKLSSPMMLESINMILKNNPALLETWQTIALEDILGRELIVNACYVPIDGQVLKAKFVSISE